jgi:hypothetical protein
MISTTTIIIGLVVLIVLIILVVGVLMLPIYDCKMYPNVNSAFSYNNFVVTNQELLQKSKNSFIEPLYSNGVDGNTKDDVFKKIDNTIPVNYTISQYGYVVDGKKEPIYLTYNVRKFLKMWFTYYFDDLNSQIDFTANIPFKIKKSIIGNIYTVD